MHRSRPGGPGRTLDTALTAKFRQIGSRPRSNKVDGRLLWLEALKAIDAALPKDTRPPEQRKEALKTLPSELSCTFQSMDCEYFPERVGLVRGESIRFMTTHSWARCRSGRRGRDGGRRRRGAGGWRATPRDTNGETAPAEETTPAVDRDTRGGATATETPVTEPVAERHDDAGRPRSAGTGAVDPVTGLPIEGAAGGGLAGEGWIVELRGYHLHNSLDEPKVDLRGNESWEFVQNTLIKNLENGEGEIARWSDGKPIEVPIKDLGIDACDIQTFERSRKSTCRKPSNLPTVACRCRPPVTVGGAAREHAPLAQSGTAGNRRGQNVDVSHYDFLVQFCWQPQPRGERLKNSLAKAARRLTLPQSKPMRPTPAIARNGEGQWINFGEVAQEAATFLGVIGRGTRCTWVLVECRGFAEHRVHVQ